MKPSKKLIEHVTKKYEKNNLELFYDSDDGTIWSHHNDNVIRYCKDNDAWFNSCLTKLWLTESCKKIK